MYSLRCSVLCLAILIAGSFPALATEETSRQHLEDSSGKALREATRCMADAKAKLLASPAEALVQLKTAAVWAQRGGDRTVLLEALRSERDMEAASGAFDASLQTGMRVLTISNGLGDGQAMAMDWKSLANTYDRMGDPGNAIDASKRSLVLFRTTGNKADIGTGLLSLMALLVKAERFVEFKHHSDEAVAFFTSIDDHHGLAGTFLLQGDAFLDQGRSADALTVLSRALKEDVNAGDADRAANLFALARAQASISNWSEARRSFDEGNALQPGLPLSDPRLFGLCSIIDEGQGDLAEALRCQRKSIALKDSLVSAHMVERVAGLQALFGLQAKDRDVASLREENQARTTQLSGERWKVRLALIVSAVLLASVVFLLVLWRKLHRSIHRVKLKNTVINAQAAEIRTKHMELERQNMRLAETLVNEEEKDLILKEIHHRMKNNLQIVIALLKLQGTFSKDPRFDELLNDCQGRIRSMAMVHEHIYKCGDLSRVNVKAHMMALANSVMRNHDLQDKVVIDMQINYDRATLDDLTPLSLLLNELLNNCAKHAFQGRERGKINIVLRRAGESRCELLFSDDGNGMEQERFFSTDSFGLELVRTLAVQMGGDIHLLKSDGTTFQMVFDVAAERQLRKAG